MEMRPLEREILNMRNQQASGLQERKQGEMGGRP
jgi:hypothetical protein